MEKTGDRIKEIRIRKGLTQEQLSGMAKINLRTLQRIEKNETEPLGNTVRNLCSAMDINAEDILDSGKKEDNSYIMFMHLSVLTFVILPLGNIIIPTIMWLTRRDRVTSLNEQGADLINFQIVWTILSYASVIFYFINFLEKNGRGWHYLILAAFLLLVNIIYPIIVIILINRKGLMRFYYPMIRFIRK